MATQTDNVNALVMAHIGLVDQLIGYVYARHTIPKSVQREDMVSAGMAGLYEAALRYDPEVGKFKTYAWWRVHGALLDYMRLSSFGCRRTKHRAKVISLETAKAAGYETERASDYQSDPFEVASDKEERTLLRTQIMALPKRHKDILVDSVYNGMSPKEIGEKYGGGKSCISRRLAKAVRALEDRLRAAIDKGNTER